MVYLMLRQADVKVSEFYWRRRVVLSVEARRADRVFHAEGQGRDEVSWPPVTLLPGESVRRAQAWYLVVFTSQEGRRYTTRFPEEQWRSLEAGDWYRLNVGVFGHVAEITHLALIFSRGGDFLRSEGLRLRLARSPRHR